LNINFKINYTYVFVGLTDTVPDRDNVCVILDVYVRVPGVLVAVNNVLELTLLMADDDTVYVGEPNVIVGVCSELELTLIIVDVVTV